MSLLIESIKLLDGEFYNLSFHERRMKNSIKALYGTAESINLGDLLSNLKFAQTGLFKCRIVYDEVVREIEFLPYVPKIIHSLKVVTDDQISYEHKYADRQNLEELFRLRDACDDILIVRDDHVTDSSYSNIVFKREGNWFTPKLPLLRGTMRKFLLESKMIRDADIRKADIPAFESFKLINAMLGFEGPEINISNIIF
ncbi:MAG TPA: aminotransferase class IV [Cyclobacteriaceae bacterium]|nr:aminotransferase class IV [Cyclobacteriaceae bacterium]